MQMGMKPLTGYSKPSCSLIAAAISSSDTCRPYSDMCVPAKD